MEFSVIQASKLYQTSNRKSHIYASFNNPLNVELVTQLVEAIDPNYETRDQEDMKSKGNKDIKDIDNMGHNSPKHKSKSSSLSSSPSVSSIPSHIADDVNDLEESSQEEFSQENEDGADDVVEEIDVKESIKSSDNPFNRVDDISNEIKDITGILNSREDTQGVSRIGKQDKPDAPELWIYYNDSINLNNVMSSVIELLNASNYNYLQFNRLARSDNAIVFIILEDGITEDMKSIKEVEEITNNV